MAYPSGPALTYTHDDLGRVTTVNDSTDDRVAVQERDLNADEDFGDNDEAVYCHSNTLFWVYAVTDADEDVVVRMTRVCFGGRFARLLSVTAVSALLALVLVDLVSDFRENQALSYYLQRRRAIRGSMRRRLSSVRMWRQS